MLCCSPSSPDSLLCKLQQAYHAGVGSLVKVMDTSVEKGTFLHSVALWVKNQLISAPLGVRRYNYITL